MDAPTYRPTTAKEVYQGHLKFDDPHLQKIIFETTTSTVAWRYFSSEATAKDYAVLKTSFLGRLIRAPIGFVHTIAIAIYHLVCITLKLLPYCCEGLSRLEILKQLFICLGRDGIEAFGHLLSPFTLYGLNLIEHNRVQKEFLLKAPYAVNSIIENLEAILKIKENNPSSPSLDNFLKACDNTNSHKNFIVLAPQLDNTLRWTPSFIKMLNGYFEEALNKNEYQECLDILSLLPIDGVPVDHPHEEHIPKWIVNTTKNARILFEKIQNEEKENAFKIIDNLKIPRLSKRKRSKDDILIIVIYDLIVNCKNGLLLQMLIKATSDARHWGRSRLSGIKKPMWVNFFKLMDAARDNDSHIKPPVRIFKNIQYAFENIKDTYKDKIATCPTIDLIEHYIKNKSYEDAVLICQQDFGALDKHHIIDIVFEHITKEDSSNTKGLKVLEQLKDKYK